MNETMALLGSWDPLWIEDHRKWLLGGAHVDGWKRRIRRATFAALKRQGTFHFYAYLPKSKRGNGRVVYRLKCDNPEYTEVGRRCQHKHRKHRDSGEPDYRLCFMIRKIDELRGHQDIRKFKTLAGKSLKSGQAALAMPFVRDQDFRVKD